MMGSGTIQARGFESLALFMARLGGVGRCPVAPATAGSLATVVFYLAAVPLQMSVQLGVLAVVLGVAVWSSSIAARHSGPDPSEVVIDEAAGMLIACFMLPKSPVLLAGAFVAFRILDIGKWPPMKQLERLPGGWGIVADDVAAGLLARLLLLWWA